MLKTIEFCNQTNKILPSIRQINNLFIFEIQNSSRNSFHLLGKQRFEM